MSYVLIAAVAFFVSGLTLVSGFGLGTILMPVFALFFPLPLAIAATAVVHLANNLFKVVLVGRHANWNVVLRFGLPAALAAVAGAGLVALFAEFPPLLSYEIVGARHDVMLLKAIIGFLIVLFACLEISPRFSSLAVPPRYLFLGGLLSGFFGGLSGNQGAFRSAFLIKAGLDRDAFVGTSVVSTVIVDVVRLLVYGYTFYTAQIFMVDNAIVASVAVAVAAAFLGAYAGTRLLKKVTLRFVQDVVAVGMFVLGTALAAGLV